MFIKLKKKYLSPSRCVYLIITVFCVLALSFYIGLKNYLSSESLRSNIEKNLGLSLSGNAKLADLNWQGWAVENTNLSVAQAKGVIKSLQIEQLSTQLSPSSLLSDNLKLKHTEIDKITLSIASADKDYMPYQFPKPQGLSKLLPEKVWLTKLDVQSLNVDLNLASGLYDFKNLKYSGSQESDTLYDGTLTGGVINLPFAFLPKLDLEKSGFALSKNAVEFYDAEVNLFDRVPATLQLNYDWEKSKFSLKSDARGVSVKDLITNTSFTGVSGKADLNFKYKWSAEKGQSYHSNIIISNGLISHPLALNLITKYSNNQDLIELDEVKIEVISPNENQQIIHAYLEQKDRLAVEAHLTIKDSERIEGSILIGFDKSQCTKYSGSVSSALKLGKKNLYWREIKIDHTYAELKLLILSDLFSAELDKFFSSEIPSTQDAIKSGGSAIEQGVDMIDEIGDSLDLDKLLVPIPIPKLKDLLPF